MKIKKITFLAIFVALAMMLSFIESQVPPLVAIPGVKMGLANIAVVFTLYRFGFKEAAGVSILRVLLMSLIFGNALSLAYALCGAVLSLLSMTLLKRFTNFSSISVSVVGGVLHNVGQIIVACFVTSTSELVYYLPVLFISGTLSGIVIGLIAGIIVKRFEKIKL